MKIFIYLALRLALLLIFTSCVHSEPIDLSLLNNESLELTKKFSSEKVGSISGLRSTGGSGSAAGCSVCAH